jgi:sugar phosphate isomerase/epimerase
MLDGVEKLARRTGVRAVIHVHSGAFMSANPLAVWYWIKDRDPAAIGAYVDLEHITRETGPASRTMAIDLLGPRTNVIAAKDFAWRVEGSAALATELTLRRVPPGQGVVPWAEVFGLLRLAGADPLVSVHSEYLSADSWRVLPLPELIRQTAEDVKYLRSVMGG